ncbi:antibiotic biosynthesis monooxygenase family protein [Ideonella sp. DXS29W]|uniref:Antibiotic biosynthesis monooxygenase family protein n=1 Tax=Ideonella lacteola TaxID=2984193 RepID=A0ABU9BV71_9BURK
MKIAVTGMASLEGAAYDAPMTSTYLFISFDARPEAARDFAALLDQVRQQLPNVPGCRGARVFAHAEMPQRFCVLEEWDSTASHQAHIDRVVASGEWEHIRAHLSVDPTSFYLHDTHSG